jgi:predicted  nucleic acid-binding Zn-ribbon protein
MRSYSPSGATTHAPPPFKHLEHDADIAPQRSLGDAPRQLDAARQREHEALRGELAMLRGQVEGLSVTLEQLRQQLRQLDRDHLRAEERDREILRALDEARLRDEQLCAAVSRAGHARRWPWLPTRTRVC